MPKFIAPHKSGAHRIAAIALYRALLRQCAAAPLPPEVRTTLQTITRNKFRANARVTSTRLLRDAFGAGYTALSHLRASPGGSDPSTPSYLASLLPRIPPALTTAPTPPPPPQHPPPRKRPALKLMRTLLARPRPLAALNGKRRRVPVLFSANRIPLLRFTKPQPTVVSMFVRSRVRQRQRRHDKKHELVAAMGVARLEDEWDEMVEEVRGEGRGRRVHGGRGKGDRGVDVGASWAGPVEQSLKEVMWYLHDESRKNQKMAELMVRVVDEERALAEKERYERIGEKKRARKERKRLREGEAAGSAAAGADATT